MVSVVYWLVYVIELIGIIICYGFLFYLGWVVKCIELRYVNKFDISKFFILVIIFYFFFSC